MTQLTRAVSEQVATVTSPPAVALERAATEKTPAQATPPAAESAKTNAPRQSEQALLDALKAAADQIESYLKSTGRELQFSIDDDTGETVVTVRDKATGDIIRQIPNAEALRLAHALGSQRNALIDISI